MIKRGDILIVNFNGLSGDVIRGTRPCVVVSNDKGNENSNIFIVAPITSAYNKDYHLPTQLKIMLARPSIVLCEQLITIPNSSDYILDSFPLDFSLTGKTLNELNRCLAISLGLLGQNAPLVA
jgi:mRNA interferase MazF